MPASVVLISNLAFYAGYFLPFILLAVIVSFVLAIRIVSYKKLFLHVSVVSVVFTFLGYLFFIYMERDVIALFGKASFSFDFIFLFLDLFISCHFISIITYLIKISLKRLFFSKGASENLLQKNKKMFQRLKIKSATMKVLANQILKC